MVVVVKPFHPPPERDPEDLPQTCSNHHRDTSILPHPQRDRVVSPQLRGLDLLHHLPLEWEEVLHHHKEWVEGLEWDSILLHREVG